MASPEYNVFVTDTDQSGGNFGYRAIEIVPPIPRSLASFLVKNIIAFANNQPFLVSGKDQNDISPHGFCDEGATVSTLLLFESTASYGGGAQGKTDTVTAMRDHVLAELSPSGKLTA